MSIKFYLFLLFVGWCVGFNMSSGKTYLNEVNNTIVINNKTWMPIGNIISTCDTFNYSTITVYKPEYNVINITYQINLTASQYSKLINLKARKCENSGCAFGYYLAKYDALDIFNIKHPKFSEQPPSGYKELLNFSETTCLPVKSKGLISYIELNASIWNIVKQPDARCFPIRFLQNVSRYMDDNRSKMNKTFFDLKFLDKSQYFSLWNNKTLINQTIYLQKLYS